MKKAQILIRLEESLLMLIEAKSRELKISKQQWIQDLVYRELANEIEVDSDNDSIDITDINKQDIVNNIDILKNDIAQIMEQIHQLGKNINRLDESDKATKTELEKIDRRLYGIKEFIIEQDERVCDEIDLTREALEANKQAIESLKKSFYAVNGVDIDKKQSTGKDRSHLEAMNG